MYSVVLLWGLTPQPLSLQRGVAEPERVYTDHESALTEPPEPSLGLPKLEREAGTLTPEEEAEYVALLAKVEGIR